MIQKKISSDIRVFGVGGGGSNLVNYMHDHGVCGADIFICNTSFEELCMHRTPQKLHLPGWTLRTAKSMSHHHGLEHAIEH